MLHWIRRQFDTHPVRAVMVVFAAYTVFKINLKFFAPAGPWWRGWHDQMQYLKSARAFLHFDLSPDQHWYPLLYPLAGAPLAWAPTPFVPINLACYAVAFWGFHRVCARFGVGSFAAGLLFLAATIGDLRISKFWLEPWTTTMSTAFIWLALAEAADMIFGERRRPWLLGALLMGIALVRPADVVISAVIGGFALWRPVLIERRWGDLARGLGGAGAALLPYAALYLAIYGWRLTDYTILSGDYGFAFSDLAWKASILLVDPSPWFPGETGLLRELPWLLTGAAGLILGVMRLHGPARWLALGMAIAALLYTLMMLAYVDLVPSGMWRFFNAHYFKWLFPMAALFSWLLFTWRDLRGVAVVLALVLLASFRSVPRPAEPQEPAKALAFVTPDAPWQDIYFARSAVVDARGAQRSPADYHQLWMGERVMAIAFKRPFEGDALWYGVTPPSVATWRKGSGKADVVLPGNWPQRPIARYATKLEFGYPCWAPPFPCGSGPGPALPKN
ncbi:hypothetical protein P6144_20280 [Sphingomonas sp. HITSZ_GF]|uniref:hypothetical protein n=1 Tax=Sphingomonas sp. HITSZ_GF TaxID=3037247 RepID=UPI00240D66E8|nr:hypothetical protein [Sphingomonas sp. HITSZ_GF]MDG2536009.1 hypothetical protein [Sphingomonas sp. HITSZ_GF]